MIDSFRRWVSGFRKRPPLNEDWAPGDLAECMVDARSWISGIGPDKGDVLTVIDVYPGDQMKTNLPDWGLRFKHWPQGYAARRFRKVPPISAEEREAFKVRIKQREPAL